MLHKSGKKEFTAEVNGRHIRCFINGPLLPDPSAYPDSELAYDGMYKLIFHYSDSDLVFLNIAAFFNYTNTQEKLLVMVTLDDPSLSGSDEVSRRRQIQLLDRIMEYPDSLPQLTEKNQRDFLDTVSRLYINAIEEIFVFA